MSRLVVALGGNALIRRGQPASFEVQRDNAQRAAAALARLVEAGHDVVVTHGNGPQVGFLALQAEAARSTVPPLPLDVLVAETQGQIGYLIVQTLRAELVRRGSTKPVVCIVTQTVVDARDQAFAEPTKPIGPMYDEAAARALAAEHGWTVSRDGDGWRRVVASPRPTAIVEAAVIGALVEGGTIVVASGGGGIPVTGSDALKGVEAVVDKDLEAVVLARAVDADALLLLTDVAAAEIGWGTANPIPIRRIHASAALAGVKDGTFAAGSMGPKMRAAAEFAQLTGHLAAIGALEAASDVLAGRSGTIVAPDPTPVASTAVPRGAQGDDPSASVMGVGTPAAA